MASTFDVIVEAHKRGVRPPHNITQAKQLLLSYVTPIITKMEVGR